MSGADLAAGMKGGDMEGVRGGEGMGGNGREWEGGKGMGGRGEAREGRRQG